MAELKTSMRKSSSESVELQEAMERSAKARRTMSDWDVAALAEAKPKGGGVPAAVKSGAPGPARGSVGKAGAMKAWGVPVRFPPQKPAAESEQQPASGDSIFFSELTNSRGWCCVTFTRLLGFHPTTRLSPDYWAFTRPLGFHPTAGLSPDYWQKKHRHELLPPQSSQSTDVQIFKCQRKTHTHTQMHTVSGPKDFRHRSAHP
jgi:hypothetical protein